MIRGTVIAPRVGGAIIALDGGGLVSATNNLNVRAPPGARVLLVESREGYFIVGRDR